MKCSFQNVFLKVAFLLSMSIVLIGCVSSSIIPNQDTLRSIKTIEVVAIEPPPITIAGESAKYISGFVPAGGYGSGSGALLVIFGIVMLANPPSGIDNLLPIASEYQNILSAEGTWVPTVELAKYAMDVLRKNGMRKVELKKGYETLPGVKNRAATVFMENWYAPIRSWYNANSSIINNKYIDNVPEIYLEIGICNYELINDQLLLQVMVKVIDSKTNMVVGKTRNWELVKYDQVDNLLMENGKKFKDFIYASGVRLIEKSIKELNL